MKNNQKGLVMGVILILLVGGGYYVSMNSKITTPSTNTSVTVDWKTCRNDKYGYELKYPQDMEVRSPGSGNSSPASCGEGLSLIELVSSTNRHSFIDLEVQNPAMLKGTVFEGIQSIDDAFLRNPVILGNQKTISSTIDGEKLVRAGNQLYVYHQGSIFNFSVSLGMDESILNQIISTLRFI